MITPMMSCQDRRTEEGMIGVGSKSNGSVDEISQLDNDFRKWREESDAGGWSCAGGLCGVMI
jgi:hypothetical protein